LARGLHFGRGNVKPSGRQSFSFSACSIAAAWSFAGCVAVPEEPAVRDLSSLYERYEHPTAAVPEDTVRRVFEAAVAILGPARILSGLSFARDHVSEANVGLGEHTNIDELEVQGRAEASFPCPGDGVTAGDNGRVEATFGVHESRLRRGFRGELDACRFRVASSFGETQRVFLSSRFVADFGADVRLGAALPRALLVGLEDTTGTSTSSFGSLDLTRDEYHLRLIDDGSVELLVDSITVGTTDLGSVVIVLWADGSVGLRERAGLWKCGEAPEPCLLVLPS
jgi:hypothetical protein